MAAATALRGTPASPGLAAGPVFIPPDGTASGRRPAASLAEAAGRVASTLEGRAAAVREHSPSGAAILEAQALMARDPALAALVEAEVQRPLGEAVRAGVATFAARLEALPDAYLRERAADVREVGRLLAAEVEGRSPSRLEGLREPSVVIAPELGPADTLSAPAGLLLALVTETGGVNSHAAIVARELGIPAVVGAAGAVAAAHGWAGATVDGDRGIVEPASPEVRTATATRTRPALGTVDVQLMANVGSPAAVRVAVAAGAAGIGLYRTEFLFMGERGPVGAREQAALYAEAAALMAPHEVVVRTLDGGADKPLPYLAAAAEPNPQLGRRGVRLWLAREELWRPQVEALVTAYATHRNLRVMIPMVAAREEMVAARRLLAREARRQGVPPPPLGMMVEVPAAAAAVEAFAGVCEFISLGTNDLTQYTLAADRELDWQPALSEWNPGVLRLIQAAIATANRLGIHSAVCGELAGRPEGAVFLAGAGVKALSMTATSLPAVAAALAGVGPERCREAAEAALRERSAERASARVRRALAQA